MKISALWLSLTLAATVFAAPEEIAFSRVDVSVKLEKTPKIEFNSIGSPTYGNNKGKVQNANWVVVVVEYTPGYLPAGKKVNPKVVAKAREGAWIDDVTLDVDVEIPGERDKKTVLSGRTEFWTVQLDGRNHVALMLVPPQILERYLPLKGRSEQTVRLADIKVQAIFRNKEGKELGVGYFNCPRKLEDAADYFQQSLAASNVIKGAVMPRHKTPWLYHQIDNYDLLKIDK